MQFNLHYSLWLNISYRMYLLYPLPLFTLTKSNVPFCLKSFPSSSGSNANISKATVLNTSVQISKMIVCFFAEARQKD